MIKSEFSATFSPDDYVYTKSREAEEAAHFIIQTHLMRKSLGTQETTAQNSQLT